MSGVCGCPSVVLLRWGAVIHGAGPVRCGYCPRSVRVAFYDGTRHVCKRCHERGTP